VADQQVPDAELEVLACLWKHRELTARQVRERMEAYRPMTHSAVSTLLKRLQDKGLITREKGPVGKAFVFRAAVAPRRTYRRIIKELMERVFVGNGMALVTTLYDAHPPTPEELDRLQELVDSLRRKQRGE